MAFSHTHARKEQPVNLDHEKKLREHITIGGLYQHYSGKKYKVIGLYRHSEDLSLYVAYEGQYEDQLLGISWARSLEMFLENVEINGILVPRFKKISD